MTVRTTSNRNYWALRERALSELALWWEEELALADSAFSLTKEDKVGEFVLECEFTHAVMVEALSVVRSDDCQARHPSWSRMVAGNVINGCLRTLPLSDQNVVAGAYQCLVDVFGFAAMTSDQ